MPIYRCNKCEFVSEDGSAGIGSKVNCARCGTPSTVYGTVFFIEQLAQRYFAARQEIKTLKEQIHPESVTVPDGSATISASQNAISAPESTLANVDTLNTSLFATAEQHVPLKAWFGARQIEAVFDHSLVDTSGFFDDAAQLIGENFALFSNLIDRVCFSYRKSNTWLNLELGALSQKDAQAVNGLCRQLYEHTFFARYHYQKTEKIVRLTLQVAPAIRQFFDGGWLEWYAFIEVVNQIKERGRTFSCARGVKVVFPNEDLHELDVLALVDGKSLICIECKSGEFRRDIEKYLRLRKRLGLERNRFIICAADLADEQASGLSAMYELTFVNLPALRKQLQSLI
jgi:hypothetical protein